MLNSKVTGHGLPVVLLHGYCEDLNLWQEFTIPLSNNYQIIAIDLPGFGKSKPSAGHISIDNVAEIVHNYLSTSLNIKKYVVLGHSLGGYVSLALADTYPASVLGYGLINSTSFADNGEKKLLRDKTVEFIQNQGVATFLQSFVKNLFTEENQRLLKDDLTKILLMGANLSKEVLISYMIAMRNRPDRSFLLKEFKHILFVGGLQDQHISYIDLERQVNLVKDDINCHLLGSAAHMSVYEEPELLRLAILEYLKTIKND